MRREMRRGKSGSQTVRKALHNQQNLKNLPPARLRATCRAGVMVDFHLGSKQRPLRRVLCLGSHCDDIEIGCGGTLLRLLAEHRDVEVYWLVFSSTPVRKKEAVEAANLFLAGAKNKKV